MEKRFINKIGLREIRNNCDWSKIIDIFRLEVDSKKSYWKNLFVKCPWTWEKTASLHINLDTGSWYNFSGGWVNENGWPIEFVQVYMRYETGQILNCYEVWRMLVEKGISRLNHRGTVHSPISEPYHQTAWPKSTTISKEEKLKKNPAIRQNLVPLLTQQGTHPQFTSRGISRATCEYLGCGFLNREKWQLAGRIVFQVRGVEERTAEEVKETKMCEILSVVLTHIWRATTREQEETAGKWRHYVGFKKSLELYNIDNLLMDSRSIEQIRKTGHVIIVEGCFDVAKLAEAGIFNVVASFGACLTVDQIQRVQTISQRLGIHRFLIWYDRDKNFAGAKGQGEALRLLEAHGFEAVGFDWKHKFFSRTRGKVAIPSSINDCCDFGVKALRWLRGRGFV